ncbi:type I restriction enzyme HsdR N-terminal domain-containing protein [Fibrobacter sp.]|uniref:type I restriction enzyme HsdR N-terminal domain-containing protein n=1 Tax=Fibrobacter sp. TaxID=35828 RepID=UPI00388DDAA1
MKEKSREDIFFKLYRMPKPDVAPQASNLEPRASCLVPRTLFDPIRKKDVPATPEEHVRQATIRYLLDVVNVPAHLVSVEFGLCAIDPKSDDRVDILVHDFSNGATLNRPWLLVECKAPGEYTWQALQVQLNRYLKVISPKYVMLALGDSVRYFALQKDGKSFSKIEKLPFFDQK